MSTIVVQMLGRLDVRRDGQAIAGLDARKAGELFCYLLLYREHPHSREALASLLSLEAASSQPRKCLRQALWTLQRALADPANDGTDQGVLLVESEWIGLQPGTDLWVDVVAFEQAFACIRGRAGRDLDAQSVQIMQEAVQLYRGDLLEGWYQDWCLLERQRLQGLFLGMLDRLMAYHESRGEYEAGLACGMTVLRYEIAHERTHRQLMRLYYLAGDRTAALRQYECCVNVLRKELNADPAQSTIALWEQIRADHLTDMEPPAAIVAPSASHGPPPSSSVTSPSLSRTLSQLRMLQISFAESQRHLKRVVQEIQATLGAPG